MLAQTLSMVFAHLLYTYYHIRGSALILYTEYSLPTLYYLGREPSLLGERLTLYMLYLL